MSYGSQLASLRRNVVDYITQKVKDCKSYRDVPGDLEVKGDVCFVVFTGTGDGRVALNTMSVDRICAIADKIHFRPLKSIKNIETVGSKTPIGKTNIEKTDNMNFEIKNDIPLPASTRKQENPQTVEKKTGRIGYSNIPLRAMRKGDCIVLFEGTNKKEAWSKRYSAIAGIRRVTALMDMVSNFHVDMTDDFKVCVWRVA